MTKISQTFSNLFRCKHFPLEKTLRNASSSICLEKKIAFAALGLFISLGWIYYTFRAEKALYRLGVKSEKGPRINGELHGKNCTRTFGVGGYQKGEFRNGAFIEGTYLMGPELQE